MARILLLLGSLPFASLALAHHAVSALYDYENIGTLEGTVQSLAWINPHIHLTIEHIAGNGEPELWRLEGSAVNLLQRRGVSSDILKVGDRVVVAGPLSSRGQKTMIASLVTLPSGEQVALFPGSAVRAGLLDPGAPAAQSSRGEIRTTVPPGGRGIFGVWRPIEKPNTDSGSGIPPWSLTEAAVAAYESYDPLTDDPALSCVQAGMPVILDTPYPVEFTERGDDILIRIEEWDGRRTIHMSADDERAAERPSPMGYSVGHWQGNTLIIATNNISYPYFDDLGTLQSGALEIIERYTLSEDGNRLDWEATAFDPEVFTEPPVLRGYMAWSPREEVKPFECAIPE